MLQTFKLKRSERIIMCDLARILILLIGIEGKRNL